MLASSVLVADPMAVLVVLLGILAALFAFRATPLGARIYSVVPILIFCYFVPTVLSNTGVIPIDPDFALYDFVVEWLLPTSLLLLVMAVDIPAVFHLGRNVLILFATAILSIIVAGPIAFAACAWLFDAEASDQVWRGLATLSGSWIGGGANMNAIKESVGASDDIFAAIVVVDVALSETWTAVLFFFAARELRMDAAIGADRRALDYVRERVERFHLAVREPLELHTLLLIVTIGFGGTLAAHLAAPAMADLIPENEVLREYAWKVILVTMFGVVLSFTPVRRLEGAGASAIGTLLLYLLVTTIGARAHFAAILRPENLPLLAVAGLWMVLHVAAVLLVRRWLRAPMFFAAVASRACIGGAASTSIVAAAFNPALVSVGVLLAIVGYAIGTLAGIVCAELLHGVHAALF